MAKPQRRKGKRPASDTTTGALPAVRHTFSAGLLGHDLSASQWIVNVGEQSMLGVDVAFDCLRLICDAVSGCDVDEWEGTAKITPPSPLVRKPDPDLTLRDFLWQLTATLALYQYTWVQSADVDGVTVGIRNVAPSRVTETGGDLLIDGQKVPDNKRMRKVYRAIYPTVDSASAGLVSLAREVFAAEMAAGAYRSDFWQQGGAPVTVLVSEQVIPNDVAEATADRWVTRRTSSPGKPAVLGRGIKPEAFGANLGTEGANQAGDKLKASIARYFGMPPGLVNVMSEAGSLTYSTTEQEFIRLVRLTVQPYLDIVGGLLTDFLPGDAVTGRRVILNPWRIIQPDFATYIGALVTATGGPFMSTEEARERFGLDPVPSGEIARAAVG